MFIEGYSFVEALYMTVIAFSTVGFEEVRPLSNNGMMFTTALIMVYIGIFAYSVSVLSAFLMDGELKKWLTARRMTRKVHKLKKHTIVCGYGRHGKEVVKQLNLQSEPLVVIENNEEALSELKSSGLLNIAGNATDEDQLVEANIADARLLISTLEMDADNVYLALTAKQLNPNIRVITRGLNETSVRKLKRAGADEVILSERIGGLYMATIGGQPGIADFFNLISSDDAASISFENIYFEDGRTHSIEELKIREKTGVNVIGIQDEDGGYDINPNPSTQLNSGMKLIVLGDDDQIQKMQELLT